MSKPEVPTRADYKVFYPITTRWADNDIYGHINNVTYYAYFDSAANRYLIEEGGLDISVGQGLGLGAADGGTLTILDKGTEQIVSDGARGERVKVKNLSSKRTVDGTVGGENLVLVDHSAIR